MLVDRSLDTTKVDRSVNALFRSTQGRALSKTFEEYDIVDPEELEDEGDNGEGEGEDE